MRRARFKWAPPRRGQVVRWVLRAGAKPVGRGIRTRLRLPLATRKTWRVGSYGWIKPRPFYPLRVVRFWARMRAQR